MTFERLTNIMTGIVAVCAVVITGLSIRSEFFMPPPVRSGAIRPTIQADWQRYASVGHVMGSRNAPVTIVEFADFECPYCRRFASDIDSLRALGERVRVIYRHFPLPAHRFALPAVRASECAAEQGRFDAIHAVLFAHPDSLGLVPWSWFAAAAGVVDSLRFAACMRSTSPIPALARDTSDARHLGIRGTPLLLVGRLRLNGVPQFDSLRAFVQRAGAANAGDNR